MRQDLVWPGPVCLAADRRVEGARLAWAWVMQWKPARKDTLGRRMRNSYAVPVGRPFALAVGLYRPRIPPSGGKRPVIGFDWIVTLLAPVEHRDAYAFDLSGR